MNGDCRKQKQNPGQVREKENGNPYYSAFSYLSYSAFSTEHEPTSLA